MQITSVNLDKGYPTSAPWKIRVYYRGEGIDPPRPALSSSAPKPLIGLFHGSLKK